MTARQLLEINFEKALRFMTDKAKGELEAQGHKVTGSLEQSFEEVIRGKLESIVKGEVLAFDYALDLDRQIDPSELTDFTGHYRDLKAWAAHPKIMGSASAREQSTFAFFVAKNHFEVGIPTAGAYKFTSNGRRTGWIAAAWDDEAAEKMFEMMDIPAVFELVVLEQFRELFLNKN